MGKIIKEDPRYEQAIIKATEVIPNLEKQGEEWFVNQIEYYIKRAEVNDWIWEGSVSWINSQYKLYSNAAFQPYYDKFLKEVKESDTPEFRAALRNSIPLLYGWGSKNAKVVLRALEDGRAPKVKCWEAIIKNKTFKICLETVQHQQVFKAGDLVKLRSQASFNHIYNERGSMYPHWHGNSKSHFKKVYMVIGYSDKTPDKALTYKKGRGSYKLVTLLPIGGTDRILVPEQNLKKANKKELGLKK